MVILMFFLNIKINKNSLKIYILPYIREFFFILENIFVH